jgi:hypothetical protein
MHPVLCPLSWSPTGDVPPQSGAGHLNAGLSLSPPPPYGEVGEPDKPPGRGAKFPQLGARDMQAGLCPLFRAPIPDAKSPSGAHSPASGARAVGALVQRTSQA